MCERRSGGPTDGPSLIRLSRALLLLVVAGAIAACSVVQLDDPIKDDLDRNRRLWLAAGIDHYRVNVQRLCFCGFDVTRMRVVEVDGGVVVAVRDVETGDLEDPQLADLFPGVEGLFEIVQDALDQEAHELSVVYDPVFGYPTQISIDYLQFAVDEELTMNASELVPLR